MDKKLLVLTGPTGVGKTALSLKMAEELGCPIISCDSRQMYKGIPIGTATPTPEEQARVKHYFVSFLDLQDSYSAGRYEQDCISLLSELFKQHNTLIMTGGSMLYMDAVCFGLDDLPQVPSAVRQEVSEVFKNEGLEGLHERLKVLDPDYLETAADKENPRRLQHAIEISLTAGVPYSTLCKRTDKKRDFSVEIRCLLRPREELYERINKRVEQMFEQGLVEEARSVLPYRHCNSLNTVGYKELFAYFDGQMSLEEAKNLIKQNTRHYAKRQMTWFRSAAEKRAEVFNFSDC